MFQCIIRIESSKCLSFIIIWPKFGLSLINIFITIDFFDPFKRNPHSTFLILFYCLNNDNLKS